MRRGEVLKRREVQLQGPTARAPILAILSAQMSHQVLSFTFEESVRN
jgi:hypothetical protein